MHLSLLLAGCAEQPAEPTPAPPPASLPAPWIASGDVTDSTAVVWVRPVEGREVTVTAGKQTVGPVTVNARGIAKLSLTGLSPGTDVHYTATTCSEDGACGQAAGSFTTAPTATAPLSLIVGGDLGGQGHCRAVEGGYRIFEALAALQADRFIANGDFIYADGTCTDTSPAGVRVIPGDFPSVADPSVDWTAADAVFDAHWSYNLADPALRAFLEKTPMISQWDDHEIINDFGAPWDAWHTADAERSGYPALIASGRAAFFDWSPIAGTSIERQFAWGGLVDLFVADGRSHRSLNSMPDGPDKTLLGAEQRQRLIEGLTTSQATWKVVSLNVPISTPTGSSAWKAGRDGIASGTGAGAPEGADDISTATGFEHEWTEILAAVEAAGVTGLVFVTTDVHHVRSIRYQVDLNEDGTPLVFHEFISGPLSAWTGDPPPLDETYSPEVLYEGSHYFNAAWLTFSPEDGLRAVILDADGTEVVGSEVRVPAG